MSDKEMRDRTVIRLHDILPVPRDAQAGEDSVFCPLCQKIHVSSITESEKEALAQIVYAAIQDEWHLIKQLAFEKWRNDHKLRVTRTPGVVYPEDWYDFDGSQGY